MKPDDWPMTPMRLELEQLRQAHRQQERRQERRRRLVEQLRNPGLAIALYAARIKRAASKP